MPRPQTQPQAQSSLPEDHLSRQNSAPQAAQPLEGANGSLRLNMLAELSPPQANLSSNGRLEGDQQQRKQLQLELALDNSNARQTNRRSQRRRRRQQPNHQQHHIRRQVDAAGGGKLDELVYVRLETLGPELGNLNTRAINERLATGLFAHFLVVDGDEANSNLKPQEDASRLTRELAPVAGSGEALDKESGQFGVSSSRRGANVNDSSSSNEYDANQRDRSNDKNKKDAVVSASAAAAAQLPPSPRPQKQQQQQPSPNLTTNTKTNTNQDADLKALRAQILSSSSGAEGERLASKCRASIERLICRLAYPSCHFKASDVSALVRPPCREDCLLLRDILCPNLNWPSFAFELRKAINETLKSTINLLDLATQAIDDDDHNDGADSDHNLSSNGNNNDSNEKLVDVSKFKRQLGDHQREVVAKKSAPDNKAKPSGRGRRENGSGHHEADRDDQLAKSYNLNSSIHFYWPHERSIENCEHLPPLRSKVDTRASRLVVGADVSSTATTNHTSTGGHITGERHYHHDRWWLWPICSNARLTKTKDSDLGFGLSLSSTLAKSDDLTPVGVSVEVQECLATNDGFNYKGTQNKTKSGLGCQMWMAQWPHKHSR